MHSFKKFFAFVLTGTFLFGELSSSVYAARKSGNSGNTKRVQKGRKASVRGAGNKRTASNRRSLKSGSSSVSSASVSVSSDGASAQEVTCRNAYVECMDIQINSLLGKYSYLSDDAAVDVLRDTGEPFRCMYYFEEDANENVKKISNDVNGLYYAYNYYCKAESEKDAAGIPINKCVYDISNGALATANSYAFYKEAYSRLMNDELKILNIESTDIYKKKLSKFTNTSSADNYKFSASEVDNLFSELGVSVDKSSTDSDQMKMFSISVNPPVGAGTMSPSGMFSKAHEICMGKSAFPTTQNSKLNTTQLKNLRGYVNSLSSDACSAEEKTFAKYYIDGVWKQCPSDFPYLNVSTGECCEDKALSSCSGEEPEPKQTEFYSAKKSCEAYEQALRSTRDDIYAKFKDQITNYLNEHISKLLVKSATDATKVATAMADYAKTVNEATLNIKQQEVETQKQLVSVNEELKKQEEEAKQLEKKYQETNKTVFDAEGTRFSSAGSQNLGTGCYEIQIAGAGGGTRDNRLGSWGELGGHGGLLTMNVCVQSGIIKATYSIGSGGGSGSSGGDSSIVFDDTEGIFKSGGAVSGTTYKAKGGNAGTGGNGTNKNSSRASGAGCDSSIGTCSTGGAGNGGSQGNAFKVFGGNQPGGSGGSGWIKFKNSN